MSMDMMAIGAARKYTEESLEGAGALKGSDGFSPIVEITKEGNVTTIAITDAEGVKTATINDGEDGASSESVNIFKGVNWCAIGDSFTWGDNANDTFTDFTGTDRILTATTWLANELEINLIQVGLGGAHLMAKVVDGEIDSTAANYVTNENWWYGMKNITATTNLITIQLGLNDNGHELFPIGEYGDETVLTSYGAFKVLMDKINETCPLAKVGLIVSDAWLSKEYAKFLYDVSAKYNLPILDLNISTVGTIYGTSADASYNYSFADSDIKAVNNEMYRISTTNGHPNTASHKLRARKLKTFLEYLMGVQTSNIEESEAASGEEVSKTGTVGVYDTSAFLGDTFAVAPTSEAFVASRNFLKFESVGKTTDSKQLVEGETVTFDGVDFTLNEDGSITINGTPTQTFYIFSNVTEDFRNNIVGQNAKISLVKSDTTTLTFTIGLYFNDASYAYNLTSTGSCNGIITAQKLATNSRLDVNANVTYDNLTVSAMLELQNDNGYLSEYTKSDCEVITASTEYAIADYPFVGIVGEHTITYKADGGVESVNAEEITTLKEANPLYGKKVTCVGDSLCYGQGFFGGYCTVLSELEPNTTFVNKGVGGSQISSNHANGGNWWIENQLSGVSDDTDYIVCEGYVNDYLTSCELGTISDGYEAELDATTFYGGMESLCKTLANTYTDKRCGFIIAHSHYLETATYANDLYLEAIKKCCDKWGIPYLDLSNKISPIVPIYKVTYYTDGLHYNEAGYRIITPAIREWLKTL